jgi:hypothetical protein
MQAGQAGVAAFSATMAAQAAEGMSRRVPLRPSDQQAALIRDLVDYLRLETEGTGGCFLVADVLESEFGWPGLSGTYLCLAGEIVAPGGHVWLVLPDGAWLDPTADQFGAGGLMPLVIPVGHPDHARYRYEFTDDFRPGVPDFDEQFPAFSRLCVPIDQEEHDRLVAERGPDWYVGPDPEAFRRHCLRASLIGLAAGGVEAVRDFADELADLGHPSAGSTAAAVLGLARSAEAEPSKGRNGTIFGSDVVSRFARSLDVAFVSAFEAVDAGILVLDPGGRDGALRPARRAGPSGP